MRRALLRALMVSPLFLVGGGLWWLVHPGAALIGAGLLLFADLRMKA